MLGPMDFSLNDEAGVLIEGFELEPLVRQNWHPPYYQRALEEAGLEKAMDLLSWKLSIDDRALDEADHRETGEALPGEVRRRRSAK